MKIIEADRLKQLPPYLFTTVDGWKKEVVATGMEIFDFSMGNPELPPAPHVVKALEKSLKIKDIHKYSKPFWEIEKNFRKAIAAWYKKKFNVTLNPDTEVLPLIGSKEGIANLAVAFLNPGDVAVIPSPAYPIHFNSVMINGGQLYNLPLKEEEGFLPNFSKIPKQIADKAKLMIVCYPHNPTAATCDLAFFKRCVSWANQRECIFVNDLAYSDFVFTKDKAPSIMQVPGAKERCVEFHTFSKSYSLAGWRLGFAVGNADVLKGLYKAKSYVDFGIFRGLQYAATQALNGPQGYVKKIVNIYKKRVDIFVDGLNACGWKTTKPKATFYVWTRIPEAYSHLNSMQFTELLVRKTGVAVAPGTGFGEFGEGYIRFALVQNEAVIRGALKKIDAFLNPKSTGSSSSRKRAKASK